MCDKVLQKEGVKLVQNSVTYFMDGPMLVLRQSIKIENVKIETQL